MFYFLCYVCRIVITSLGRDTWVVLLSFIHLLYMHLSLLTLLVSWEASVIPDSPEYFISTVFK